MPTRRMFAVTVLLLLLTMAGCAPYKPVKSSVPPDTKQFDAANDALTNQTKALEKENAAYEKQLADQQAEIAVMTKSISDQQTEIATAHKQVTELNKAIDELSTQVKQLQDTRQKEAPLKETELVQPKKEPVKPKPSVRNPKKIESKKSPDAKEQSPEAAEDLNALSKRPPETTLKKSPRREVVPAQVKKGTETPGETGKDLKKGTQKESVKPKATEPRSVDDLSAQMKAFEDAGLKADSPQTVQAPLKKEQGKPATNVKIPAKDARDPKAVKIKVLAGDGNIDSAKAMSKQLGKMGYRVNALDRAPRSDFGENTIYYGAEYRTTAEAMVKKLGKGAVTRPLNWSSTFDIIVVTGRRR